MGKLLGNPRRNNQKNFEYIRLRLSSSTAVCKISIYVTWHEKIGIMYE